MRSLATVAVIALTGCLSHLPPAGHKHMEVRWEASFEAASARAAREGKPIVACLIAGEVDGLC